MLCLSAIGVWLPNYPLSAQPAGREVVTQPMEWFAIQSNVHLNKHWVISADAQLRFVQDFESMQHMIRAGLEYFITPSFSVIPLGYAYIHNYQYGKQPAAFLSDEQRIWEQIFYKHTYKRFAFQHRLRFEQRWSEKFHLDTNGDAVNEGYQLFVNRMRYRFLTIIPLGSHKKMEPGGWGLSAFDEFFISWGDPVTFHEPDQNRIFAGVTHMFTGKYSISFGPCYQMLIKANGAKQENNVGIFVQFNLNFDVRKPAG